MAQSLSSKSAEQPTKDGRLLRSERSRRLIIDAMIELIGEGFLIPTAQQTALRADVGIRSVFRHFDDMDDIFETANALIFAEKKTLFTGGDRLGAIDKRVIKATEQFSGGYAAIQNFMLSGKIRMWNTPVIAANYTLNQARLKKELDDWFPEIQSMSHLDKAYVYSLMSFDFWYQLHETQAVSQDDCIKLVSKRLQMVLC
ncbi:MAG: TetR/AcrR family transcriptional regulator [Porticoccaceae bacterium]|nr:TetR/AcrR family transcriptional regulator [Porticoccaceae bacterium]